MIMIKRCGLSMLIFLLFFGFVLPKKGFSGEETSSKEPFSSQFNKAMLTVYNAKTPEDLEKAASEFLAARALNPSNPQVHFNLGLIYLELNEFTRAVDSFEAYLSLSPASDDAARARNLLTRARKLQKRVEETKIAMLNPSAWHFVEKNLPTSIRHGSLRNSGKQKVARFRPKTPGSTSVHLMRKR